MQDTFASRTTSALKWSTIGTFTKVVFQIGFIAVMGRLLGPAEYGLLALANVFMRFMAYFSRMGLGPALIQREKIDQEDIRASFTLAMALGLAFALLAVLISPLATLLFRNEAVAPVIQVLAISFVLSGLSLTPMSLLRRKLNFRTVALIENLAFVLGNGLVAITCALLGMGVWSLVIGILTQHTITVLVAMVMVRHSLAPVFSLRAYRRCLGYGAHYSVNTFLDFLYANVEVFVLGRFFSEKLVGLYNRGFTLANMPVEYFVTSITRVMFPAFSKLQTQKEKLAEVFVTTFAIIGLVCAALSCGMVPAAREVILTILGEKWMEAIFPLQILALAVPLTFLMSIQGVLLDSMGKLRNRTQIRVLGLAVKVVFLAIGMRSGFKGLLVAILAAQVCQQLIYVPFILTNTGLGIRRFLSLYCTFLADAGFVAGLIWGVTVAGRMLDLPVIIVLAAQIVTGGAALFGVFMVVQRYSLCGIRRSTLQSVPFVGRFWK